MSTPEPPRPDFEGMWWDPVGTAEPDRAVLRETSSIVPTADLLAQLREPKVWDSRARWTAHPYGAAKMPGGGRLRPTSVTVAATDLTVDLVHRAPDGDDTPARVRLALRDVPWTQPPGTGAGLGGYVQCADPRLCDLVAVFTINRIGACHEEALRLAAIGASSLGTASPLFQPWLADTKPPSAADLLGNGAALTVSTGISREDALRVLAPQPLFGPDAVEVAGAWIEQQPAADHLSLIEVSSLQGATVTLELNGVIDPREVEELSRGGTCAAVFYSVNADAHFLWAADGVLLRTLDPVLYDAEGALAQEAGLDVESDAIGASLELLRRLTGVDLTGSAVSEGTGRVAVVRRV